MEWIQANPPTNGVWICALRITPLCPVRLDIDQLTIDHIKPKGSNPELAHELSNLQPACIYCNGEKGSKTL
jgi:5-methylcytosine-specific restriction endonuclease McrA